MEKNTTDPWEWGKYTNSVQAVEIKQPEGTLYCSGQVAIDANGQPVAADMNVQLELTTRQKRIKEIVDFTGRNLKPKILQWTKKSE